MSDAEEAVYEHPTASDTIIEDATCLGCLLHLACWLLGCFLVANMSQVCEHVNTLLGVYNPQLGALQKPDAPLAKWDSTPIGPFCPSIVKQQILP